MSMQKTFEPQFSISAKVTYIPAESRPESDYHFFAYKISIKNESAMQAQLLSRHWVITDGLGQSEEVRGAGVAGMQPKIAPGQIYEYESACPLPTNSGTMKGSYQMITDDGIQFDIDIPEFYLIAPSALH
jgi:ApaG protein